MAYIKDRRGTIRSNIESRYSDLGISATIPAFESYAFKLDTTAPTVESTSPSNSATGVSTGVYVLVTFSEEMDNTTITNNNSDTSCSSGTFQISANNFEECYKFNETSGVVEISNTSKTFKALTSLSNSTTYKFRITSGATDVAGNSVSMTAISFTTN
jgi:hypothetical protein